MLKHACSRTDGHVSLSQQTRVFFSLTARISKKIRYFDDVLISTVPVRCQNQKV